MNRFFQYCTLALVVTMLGTSCKKIETEPRDWITEDLVWDEVDQNAALAGWFLNDVYNYMPVGFNRIGGDLLDAASGDAMPSRNNTTVEFYTNGRVSVVNNPDPYWGRSYFGIRRANIFLANIDRVPTTEENIRYWKAEARFIRSLMYFEMLKRYGGVPLIGDTLFTLQDDLQIPRNNFSEVVEYIVSECDAIKDELRKEPIADAFWGRIPRGAAIALKCRVYLYAASPLFNGGGISSNATIKALNGYTNADPSRWQKVIDAAQELRALNYYGLQANFGSIFTTKKNIEVILASQAANNSTLEAQNAPVGYRPNNSASEGRTSPTQNLVDAFPTETGLPISNPASGYDALAPYAKRDPRMNFTVFYNGMRWLSRPVETFEGGLDKPNNQAVARIQTKTGYYMRKFLGDFTNNTTYSNQSHNFILFRFAEILLNEAEALNEMSRTDEAVVRIIDLRKRAGIKAGTDNRYGIAAGITQTELRSLIQNERRIELAFEEHRFWDVRRWKIAPQVLNTPLTGMKITKDAAGLLQYQREQVGTISFVNRLYHMPIPYDEAIKNLALIQNEGW